MLKCIGCFEKRGTTSVQLCQQCFKDATALARLRKWREDGEDCEFEIATTPILWNVTLIGATIVTRDETTLSAAVEAALKAWGEA